MITEIENLLRKGHSGVEIQKILHVGQGYIDINRSKLNLPGARVIRVLNNNPEFEEFFTNLYLNSSLDECVTTVKKHFLFRKHPISKTFIGRLRTFYRINHKMPENVYKNVYDRIRGYMIRNSKSTAQRRGLEFNLHFSDFDLPEFCPLLGTKLTYSGESNFNYAGHASLDRIDNSKGYVKGNVIVISRLANSMKNAADFSQLKSFSTNILKLINHYEEQGALECITDLYKDIPLRG